MCQPSGRSGVTARSSDRRDAFVAARAFVDRAAGEAVEAMPTLVRNLGMMRFFLREMRQYLFAGLVRR